MNIYSANHRVHENINWVLSKIKIKRIIHASENLQWPSNLKISASIITFRSTITVSARGILGKHIKKKKQKKRTNPSLPLTLLKLSPCQTYKMIRLFLPSEIMEVFFQYLLKCIWLLTCTQLSTQDTSVCFYSLYLNSMQSAKCSREEGG